jgi:hypothetical protein
MLSKQLFCNVIFLAFLFISFDNSKEVGTGKSFLEDPCESVKITVNLSPALGNLSNVEVVVSDAKKPVRYVFFNSEEEPLNQDYKSALMKNLKPGKYTCLVRDGGNCRKKIEFEVK